MAAAVLRSDLIVRVREIANMEASTFVTDAELGRRLDSAARRLYNKLVAAQGQEYLRSTATITTVPGQATYDLPEDFWRLLALSALDGTTYRRMAAFELNEVASLLNIQNPTPFAIRYRLNGQQPRSDFAAGDLLELVPTPVSEFTIRCDYIPTLACEESEGDVRYNGVSGWEEWMVLDVAIMCLAKEESDPSLLMAQRAQWEAEIASLADGRDEGNPARVSDVRGDLDGARIGLMPPRWAVPL
jgi:hypothetical protein